MAGWVGHGMGSLRSTTQPNCCAGILREMAKTPLEQESAGAVPTGGLDEVHGRGIVGAWSAGWLRSCRYAGCTSANSIRTTRSRAGGRRLGRRWTRREHRVRPPRHPECRSAQRGRVFLPHGCSRSLSWDHVLADLRVDAYAAVSDGQLFLRTSSFLWVIGDRKTAATR